MEISNRLKKYFKFSIVVLILLFFMAVLFVLSHKPVLAPENSTMEYKNIKINGYIINAEIADTLEKQEKGLSGRQTLPEGQGMLFVFGTSGHYSFWMKDMNFSLDFIWISGNEIVEIIKNVQPEGDQPQRILIPKNKIDKVLEVSAGVTDRMGVQEGDKVEF